MQLLIIANTCLATYLRQRAPVMMAMIVMIHASVGRGAGGVAGLKGLLAASSLPSLNALYSLRTQVNIISASYPAVILLVSSVGKYLDTPSRQETHQCNNVSW